MRKLFEVSASKYDARCRFSVYHPASLDNPHNNSVMFINKKNVGRVDRLAGISESIVYCPTDMAMPSEYADKNLVIPCVDPRLSYCLFFRENKINYLPASEPFDMVNGALVAKTAVIGKNVQIMPFAYVGGEVMIGDNSYIGVGTRIVGRVSIGNDVVIRENSVVGADGLSTDRDADGKSATMPQFGGVKIGNDVRIGALTVIARGAIDDTIIDDGARIDNSCFISHNVHVGEDTFVVGESIMFGGSSTGKQVFISGNSTIRNKAVIGDKALVGMGAVVTKNVEENAIVLGNPAKKKER